MSENSTEEEHEEVYFFCGQIMAELQASVLRELQPLKTAQKRVIPRCQEPLKSAVSKYQVRKRSDQASDHLKNSVLSTKLSKTRFPASDNRSKTPNPGISESKKTDIQPLQANSALEQSESARLSALSPAPRPDTAEKTPRRPNSSQSSRCLSKTQSPISHSPDFNFLEFRSFLSELKTWISEESDSLMSPGLKDRVGDMWEDVQSGRRPEARLCVNLLHELDPFLPYFPKSLSNLYTRILTRSVPVPSVSQAKLRLEQSIAALTLKKLSDLKSLNQPSPEVEVTCLAFLLLLSFLDGNHVLSLHKTAWKSFQLYLQQPGHCLQVLKRTCASVESSGISEGNSHPELVTRLKDRLEKIDPKTLRQVDKSGAAVSVHHYLKETVAFHAAVIGKNPTFPQRISPDIDATNREKKLSSLYQRTIAMVPPQ